MANKDEIHMGLLVRSVETVGKMHFRQGVPNRLTEQWT